MWLSFKLCQNNLIHFATWEYVHLIREVGSHWYKFAAKLDWEIEHLNSKQLFSYKVDIDSQ
jgi:hypothetical protein